MPPAEAYPEAADENTPPLPPETGAQAPAPRQTSRAPLPLRRTWTADRAGWSGDPAGHAEAVPAAWQAPLRQRVVRPAAVIENDPGFAPEPPVYRETRDEGP